MPGRKLCRVEPEGPWWASVSGLGSRHSYRFSRKPRSVSGCLLIGRRLVGPRQCGRHGHRGVAIPVEVSEEGGEQLGVIVGLITQGPPQGDVTVQVSTQGGHR